MSSSRRPPGSSDDDVVYLDDGGGDELRRALAEAERAVSAVEERHRKSSGEIKSPFAVAKHRPHPQEPEKTAAEIEREVYDQQHAAEVSALEQVVAEAKERAVKAEEEAGKLREALLRKSADFENLKRRTEREKTDFFKFALAETFRDFLATLDNFERALAHSGDSVSTSDFRVGIEMIARQLADALKKYGLVEIPAIGMTFDPNFHEAVMREETSTSAPGTVLEVLQKGYVLNDRLLRPALVKVAAAPPAAPSE